MKREHHLYLHPTMYLLIPYSRSSRLLCLGNLHPTMYLLILHILPPEHVP